MRTPGTAFLRHPRAQHTAAGRPQTNGPPLPMTPLPARNRVRVVRGRHTMRMVTVVAVLGGLALAAPAAPAREKDRAKPGVVRRPYGKTKDGVEMDLFVLTNKGGMTVKLIPYGATITELWV